MLMSYHWPGNVRELANVIERAVVVCDANVVHAHHLPPTLQTAEASDTVIKLSLATCWRRSRRTRCRTRSRARAAAAPRPPGCCATTERIFNYKVGKYEIDWRRFRT